MYEDVIQENEWVQVSSLYPKAVVCLVTSEQLMSRVTSRNSRMVAVALAWTSRLETLESPDHSKQRLQVNKLNCILPSVHFGLIFFVVDIPGRA